MTVRVRALHWREYGIEAFALGCFMISACSFGTLIFHPASPAHGVFEPPWAQRAAMGTLMGLTLVALVYSPWGRRSGAQMNPAFTLTFFRLGKISTVDAVGYVVAQFVGGTLGVWVAARVLGAALAHPMVHYVVTRPGDAGTAGAFAGEFGISMLLMLIVLTVSASARWKHLTGVCAAIAVATFITLEAPLSGMSMNPARSVASAATAGDWHAIWIYFVAPMLGMGAAAWAYTQVSAAADVPCGKMVHSLPCIFCEHVARRRQRGAAASTSDSTADHAA